MVLLTHPDLTKLTLLFLIPNHFLVAALGGADSNLLRTAVSLLGLVLSVLWLACSRDAASPAGDSTPDGGRRAGALRARMLSWLPLVFVVGWLISTVIHGSHWNRPLHG